MPAHNSFGLHDHQNIRPSRPQISQRSPEETIQAVQSRTRSFAFENRDLLAQRENFERCIHATAEEDSAGRDHCKYQIEHEATVVAPGNGATAGLRSRITGR